VAVNDLADPTTLAHLLKYDSVHGRYPGTVDLDGDRMSVNGTTIKVLSERDPAKLPWKTLGVDVVLESTGFFTHRDTHVINHIDDILNLLRIDDVIRQMIIDVCVGEVALLFAAGDQLFELLCLLVAANHCTFVAQDGWPFMLKIETSRCTVLVESNLKLSLLGVKTHRKQGIANNAMLHTHCRRCS